MAPKVKILTKYDYEERALVAPGLNFGPKDKSLTNQADLPNTDINLIMARFEKTGLIPGTERKPMYGDFSEVPDYHTQLSAIRRVEGYMLLLPAKIRNRFNNNPQELIDFLNNPANDGEAVELGLKVAPPRPAGTPPGPGADNPVPGTPGAPAGAPAPPPAG